MNGRTENGSDDVRMDALMESLTTELEWLKDGSGQHFVIRIVADAFPLKLKELLISHSYEIFVFDDTLNQSQLEHLQMIHVNAQPCTDQISPKRIALLVTAAVADQIKSNEISKWIWMLNTQYMNAYDVADYAGT